MMVPGAFASMELKDANDQPVRLSSLWAKRPALLVFIRHFG